MNVTFECRYKYDDGFELDTKIETKSSCTVLFGPSGSGKTTVLSLIAGTLNPDKGQIAVGSRVLFDHQQNIALPPEKRRIGNVFQDPLLFPHMSVIENIRFGRRFKDQNAPSESMVDIDSLTDVLAIGDLMERRPQSLSGGEQQRVAIARALASSPDLLLMDEPVSSLGDDLKYSILGYLKTALETWKVPLLYVTHSMAERKYLGGDLVAMEHGKNDSVGS